MQAQDQFVERKDEILESLNERNYTLSLFILGKTQYRTIGFEDSNNPEYLEQKIMNISLINYYYEKMIFLESELVNLIFSEINELKVCKQISEVMIKSDTEIDFNQLFSLISNIPSVKKIFIQMTNLSKGLLLIAEMISDKLPNLEELELFDDKYNSERKEEYLNQDKVGIYQDGNTNEEEIEKVVAQYKLKNLVLTNISGVSFLFQLFPNIEVLNLYFGVLNLRKEEFLELDLKFISELKQLKELYLEFRGKISTDEVTSICKFLSQSSIKKINLNIIYLSFEQELYLALQVRNMKHPESFYFNDINLLDLSQSSKEAKRRFSVFVLGCLGRSNKINNLLGYFKCSIEDLAKNEKNRINLLLSLLQVILSPFKKMKLSSHSCPYKEGQPQFVWKSSNSIKNANSLWNSEESKEERKKWCLSKIKFTSPSLQIVNLLSKDLVYLEFEKYHFNLFEIDQFTSMFPQLITICGISLILNEPTEQFILNRNVCLRILMMKSQSQSLEQIFKVKGHFINIIDFNLRWPISFEQVKKITEQIFNLNNRILCETNPFINYHKKPQLKVLDNYRLTVIQQLIHSKIFYKLIADHLTINPYMVFQENWF